MGIFVGIIIAVLAIVFGVIAYVYDGDSPVLCGVMAVLCVISTIGFIIVPFSFHTVDTGEVAVVKTFGEAKEVKGPGLNYDFWMTNSYEYIDTKAQELSIETMAYSSDAQVMTIQMAVQYQALGDKAVDIVKEYGSLEALTSRITSIVTETPKSVVSTRTAMDIIANRGAITPEVEAAIIAAIGEDYYVAINKVTITNIDFSDTFEQAVEKKMVAEQEKLKADYENEKKLAKAEADAKAKLIAAEAEKQANELLEKSLTPQILQEMYLDKWDGKLPQVVTDGEMIMQIPEMAAAN
jgi:regulator of protease activity HflC (stomatin/prohibitin superfamily)